MGGSGNGRIFFRFKNFKARLVQIDDEQTTSRIYIDMLRANSDRCKCCRTGLETAQAFHTAKPIAGSPPPNGRVWDQFWQLKPDRRETAGFWIKPEKLSPGFDFHEQIAPDVLPDDVIDPLHGGM